MSLTPPGVCFGEVIMMKPAGDHRVESHDLMVVRKKSGEARVSCQEVMWDMLVLFGDFSVKENQINIHTAALNGDLTQLFDRLE